MSPTIYVHSDAASRAPEYGLGRVGRLEVEGYPPEKTRGLRAKPECPLFSSKLKNRTHDLYDNEWLMLKGHDVVDKYSIYVKIFAPRRLTGLHSTGHAACYPLTETPPQDTRLADR